MSTVEDILMVKGPDVIVTTPDATVLEAARLMAEDDVGSIIVREGEEVVGIFTERDLLHRVVAVKKDPETVLIREVMSTPVASCRLEDTVEHCARVFAESKIRHLAVIEDGVLLGLIGLRDVRKAEAVISQ